MFLNFLSHCRKKYYISNSEIMQLNKSAILFQVDIKKKDFDLLKKQYV
jgi:hypothetical protein